MVHAYAKCAMEVGNDYYIQLIINAATKFSTGFVYSKHGLLFLLQVRLGKNGVEEVLGLGPLSGFEKDGLERLKPELAASIEKGVKFANQS